MYNWSKGFAKIKIIAPSSVQRLNHILKPHLTGFLHNFNQFWHSAIFGMPLMCSHFDIKKFNYVCKYTKKKPTSDFCIRILVLCSPFFILFISMTSSF